MPYLHFPSLDVLRLALFSGAVPGPVQGAACTALRLLDGGIVVETACVLDRQSDQALKKFGVKVTKRIGSIAKQAVSSQPAICWLQLLPLEVVERADQDTQIVLLRVASMEKFVSLASEMLRLGNDRIAYRAMRVKDRVSATSTAAEAGSWLMRVHEPPYYTLIDVLDGGPESGAVVLSRTITARVGATGLSSSGV